MKIAEVKERETETEKIDGKEKTEVLTKKKAGIGKTTKNLVQNSMMRRRVKQD